MISRIIKLGKWFKHSDAQPMLQVIKSQPLRVGSAAGVFEAPQPFFCAAHTDNCFRNLFHSTSRGQPRLRAARGIALHVNRWSLGHSKAHPYSTPLGNQVIWGKGARIKKMRLMMTTAGCTLKKYIKYSSNMEIENTIIGFGFHVDGSLV